VTYRLTLQDELPIQRPTVPGKVDGIVGWEPCVLQCRVCGVTTTNERSSVAAFIILSGFHFHLCEERKGIRMCPACLKSAIAACPSGRCKHA
jgi:hypothetical protein